ncbi:MAG: FG-GAP repeat protein [Planctomycetota bacterium]
MFARCSVLLLVVILLDLAQGQSLPIQYQFSLAADEVLVDACALGDVDGDGRHDFAMVLRKTIFTAPGSTSVVAIENYVDVRSGMTGASIHLHGPFNVTDLEFGDVQAIDVGDVDGDGFADLAIANDLEPTSGLGGTSFRSDVFIFSGFDGSTVHHWEPLASPVAGYGAEIRCGKDFDQDGVLDLLIGQSLGINAGAYAEVRSGATGAVLQSVSCPSGTFMSLDWGDDGDDDGFPEILVSVDNLPLSHGHVHVFRGFNGTFVATVSGATAGDLYGKQLSNVGDVDGDGRDDLLVHGVDRNNALSGIGWLGMHSAQGQLLFSRITLGTGIYSQDRYNPIGDINGDGVADFTTRYEVFSSSQGIHIEFARRVFSGSDGTILADLPIRSSIISDVNGDGIAEFLWCDFDAAAGAAVTVTASSIMGANTYGTAPGALSLSWEPRLDTPEHGDIVVSGATPSAAILVAVSLAPTDSIIGGTPFPLYVSPTPNDLLFTANLMADSTGIFRAFENLREPTLFGFRFYLQAAELSPAPTTTNGLELLFGR